MPSRTSVPISNVRRKSSVLARRPRHHDPSQPHEHSNAFMVAGLLPSSMEDARSRPCGRRDCLGRNPLEKAKVLMILFFAVLPRLATFDIVLGSLYSAVAVVEAFGIFA